MLFPTDISATLVESIAESSDTEDDFCFEVIDFQQSLEFKDDLGETALINKQEFTYSNNHCFSNTLILLLLLLIH